MKTSLVGLQPMLRMLWWSLAVPLTVLGVVGACLALDAGGVLLLTGSITAVAAFGARQLRSTVDWPLLSRPAPLLGLLAGVGTLAASGLVLEFGGVGFWVAVLIAAAAWPAFARVRRPAPAAEPAGPVDVRPPPPGPPMECLPPDGLPSLSELSSLSTPRLCWAWRLSYLRVRNCRFPSHLEHLTELRRGYLEELQRRDPVAFARWLPTARAASDPARFFCRQPQR